MLETHLVQVTTIMQVIMVPAEMLTQVIQQAPAETLIQAIQQAGMQVQATLERRITLLGQAVTCQAVDAMTQRQEIHLEMPTTIGTI